MPDVTPRDYELADHVVADTPERLKAIGDPLRTHLCDLVLERAMTVSELAEATGRPKGTIAYHVDKLVAAGLLQVVRTRRVRAIDERFYGRVARTIVLPGTPGELPFVREVLAEVDHEMLAEAKAAEAPEDAAPGLITYRRARIPLDRVAEYARRLDELAVEFVDEPRTGGVEIGLYIAMFPTNRGRSPASTSEIDPGETAP